MTAFAARPQSQQAGILSNTPQFQRYVAVRLGAPTEAISNTAAAEYIRTVCKIKSRRNLDTDKSARGYFERLKTDFDAWTGRIASQR